MTAKKHLKMTNPGEVRRAMTRVSNMVLNREITPQQANAVIYAGNAVLVGSEMCIRDREGISDDEQQNQ